MAASDGVAEAERQQGIAEAEQVKAEAADAEAMRSDAWGWPGSKHSPSPLP